MLLIMSCFLLFKYRFRQELVKKLKLLRFLIRYTINVNKRPFGFNNFHEERIYENNAYLQNGGNIIHMRENLTKEMLFILKQEILFRVAVRDYHLGLYKVVHS